MWSTYTRWKEFGASKEEVESGYANGKTENVLESIFCDTGMGVATSVVLI